MPELNPSPVSVTETKVIRPFIRPLDILAVMQYGCTWIIFAMLLAVRAGYIGDYSDPVRPGTVAATIICGIACLVIGIVIVANDGEFTPKRD